MGANLIGQQALRTFGRRYCLFERRPKDGTCDIIYERCGNSCALATRQLRLGNLQEMGSNQLNKVYRCPLCKSVITKAQFERVTHVEEVRKKEIHEAHKRETELRRKVREAKRRERDAKQAGRHEGKEAEKRRSERLVMGLEKKLATANERIRQLRKGSTPQTEGLEFEETLHARLTDEFPADRVDLEGKGGDILHTVLVRHKPAGLILYECKRTQQILRKHIEQAMRDKRTRHADFAILVTTGKRRGFTGLGREGPVLLVAHKHRGKGR